MVNGNISDIFFNMDHRAIYNKERDEVEHLDLEYNAALLLECLHRLGVETPTQSELIADFYERL